MIHREYPFIVDITLRYTLCIIMILNIKTVIYNQLFRLLNFNYT